MNLEILPLYKIGIDEVCEIVEGKPEGPKTKGLHRGRPLLCLVAGTGFEPVTFGL
jgi:hypothetical protein